MRRRWLVALGVSTSAACLFPSLDGLSGDAGVAPDATTEAGDATADAGEGDAADVADAPVDVFSCSLFDARFCDDFDDSDAALFTRWSGTYQARGGLVSRVASDASPPFAAGFTAGPWDGGAPYATLTRAFVVPITTSAKLSFDLRVNEWATAPTAYFNTADLSFDGKGGTNLVLRQSGSVLQETIPVDGGYAYPAFALTMNPTLGQWVHVDMLWTFSAAKITAEVHFDGQTVLPPTTLDSRLNYGIPLLTMGETYADPTSDHTSFDTDDVLLDFE